MANKYVSFMSDSHLLWCIESLFKSYEETKQQANLKKFYKNKVDPIKMNFDGLFNDMAVEELIDAEITRQNDKTINNAIGTFHENLIGGIPDFVKLPVGGGYDIKKIDNTIFAEVKNKHNTMNSSSTAETFRKLVKFADAHPGSTAYLIQIIALKSTDELWKPSGNNFSYHNKVRLISIDRFYKIATGIDDAFYQLCKVLPLATKDFLNANSNSVRQTQNAVLTELSNKAKQNHIDILDQIMKDNFTGYIGF